ncbi:hypothetical protein LX15_001233 [Streptoalloteichus tenebrarius]|uniref:Uncharacterized protein n=1 Tax=Streptoalloteichus tenebrarius (strain ATCC 17920 / DSM 40477 / JCM 4838 / CBS 697.72 / NBRC 16177 / NCIMB 11028 / NRRL B-12390 / A12253. 1 / ISP 5477) TaxID=1933 RepID=A0ABT1HPY1_STRSD|nr:hypothetical protein [Streptoalloteichus tenebrarius]MCP2257548.1 hypothetical protein [Streptoalloteichus tenebrarius]BFE98499.1 hypothetical protein GCM10020241_01750 [Streptoalloteichus tenebrarius]
MDRHGTLAGDNGHDIVVELLLHKVWEFGIVLVVAVLALVAMVIIWRRAGRR